MFAKLFKSKTDSNVTVVGNGNQIVGAGGHDNVFIEPSNKVLRSVTLRFGDTTKAAVSLNKSAGISLAKKVADSVASLSRGKIMGIRMDVVALIDASGSMDYLYKNNTVEDVTEQGLALAITIDEDGVIPTGTFGSNFSWRAEVTQDNYRGVVAREKFFTNGSTNLSAALAELEEMAKKTTNPIFAMIVTDGAPNNRKDVVKRIQRLSQYPVFIKFLVVGKDNDAWKFVEDELNNMDDSLRLVDNVNSRRIIDINSLTSDKFADILTEELHEWVDAAKAAGLLV